MKLKQVVFSLFLIFSLILVLAPSVKAHTATAPYTVPFVMGSTNIPIGFIRVWNDTTNLYVLFEIDHDSYPNYAMSVSHLEVSKNPLSWSAPGQWTYSHVYSPYVGGEVYSINKLVILAPYLALISLVSMVAVAVKKRRR
ncbi:MAG: hypothetical protein QXZ53_04195 [Candidatus Bathyarchaeia archaeon]